MQSKLFAIDRRGGLSEGVGPVIETRLRYPWWEGEAGGSTNRTGDMFSEASAIGKAERFGSGASAKWDFLGYALVGSPVGVTATELSPGVMKLIVSYLDRGGRVFVDSGAFGAFRAKTQLDFEKQVFPRYEELLRGTRCPQGLLLVMPDVVGDQHATLALQRRFLSRIVTWIERGVEAIFPVQNPDADPIGVYADIRALIGNRPHAVGVPSNERAWKPHQVVGFAGQVRPGRMHLLGLARKSVLRQIERDVADVSPDTRLSCDACELIAHAGKGRRLTDRARSRMESAIECVERGSDPEVPLPALSTYMVDVLYTPGFLSPKQAIMVGESMGYSGPEWASRFADASRAGMLDVLGRLDPDEEWIHDAVTEVVAARIYRPWVRRTLAGPIRSWEVARIATGKDPYDAGICPLNLRGEANSPQVKDAA